MNSSAILVAAAALCASLAAQAQRTISFEPANPTMLDEVTLVLSDTSATCPTITPTSVRHVNGVIHAVQGNLFDCGFGPYRETRHPIGRLPAGGYTVQIHRNTIQDPVDIAASFTVSFPANAGTAAAAAPLVEYTGHYLTQNPGEGVFIQQFGGKLFASFFSYAVDGRPAWQVMPNSAYQFAGAGGMGFYGPAYQVQRPPGSPPIVTPIGPSQILELGGEFLLLRINSDGVENNRTLRRFRF